MICAIENRPGTNWYPDCAAFPRLSVATVSVKNMRYPFFCRLRHSRCKCILPLVNRLPGVTNFQPINQACPTEKRKTAMMPTPCARHLCPWWVRGSLVSWVSDRHRKPTMEPSTRPPEIFLFHSSNTSRIIEIFGDRVLFANRLYRLGRLVLTCSKQTR